MNNKYKIKVGAPLLRPGLTIETEVSWRYAAPATEELMNIVREINAPPLSAHEKLRQAGMQTGETQE